MKQIAYGAMQIGIVAGYYWFATTSGVADESGDHVTIIIGVFFALMATAAVYWTGQLAAKLKSRIGSDGR